MAIVFFCTSVLRCGVVVVKKKDFLVVVANYAAHVRHAAVAYFHAVLVEDGWKL